MKISRGCCAPPDFRAMHIITVVLLCMYRAKHLAVLRFGKCNTLLKSDVTRPDHVVRCRGSQECGSRFVNFACKFHRRWHRLRITLKSTTLLFMRSSNVWTTKLWQRSKWPLDFNSVYPKRLKHVHTCTYVVSTGRREREHTYVVRSQVVNLNKTKAQVHDRSFREN